MGLREGEDGASCPMDTVDGDTTISCGGLLGDQEAIFG
jgi:hypothetical protein